jgi:MFS family permease
MAGSGVGMLVGGWLADRIPQRFADPIQGRRYISMAGFLVAAVCMFAGTRCDDPLILAAFWTAAMCAMHVQLPNWWSVAIPQGGRHTATIFGLMNGLGVIGAMASQGFVGVHTDWQKSLGREGRAAWDPLFDVYVGVLVAGAVAWWFYRFTPLPEPAESTEEETW